MIRPKRALPLNRWVSRLGKCIPPSREVWGPGAWAPPVRRVVLLPLAEPAHPPVELPGDLPRDQLARESSDELAIADCSFEMVLKLQSAIRDLLSRKRHE